MPSVLVSRVPFAPVATNTLLRKATPNKSLVLRGMGTAEVQVTRSGLVNMFPPLPTATYMPAPETVPKAMLFMPGVRTGFVAVPGGVHVSPSVLVNIEPSVPSATNRPENMTALRFALNPGGRAVGGIQAVTPKGLVLV